MRHKSQAGFWGISGAHIPLLCMLTLTNGADILSIRYHYSKIVDFGN